MWNNVVNAWWSIVFYPATDAPGFHRGAIAMICACVATLGVTALVWALERRERRQRPQEQQQRKWGEMPQGEVDERPPEAGRGEFVVPPVRGEEEKEKEGGSRE
jgi:hypothetical protein